MERFKRIVNWAVEIKWIQVNPFKEYSCPQKKHKRKKLTFQQLVALEQQPFSDPTIHYVKELFLHSCYTGFAFAEAMAVCGIEFPLTFHVARHTFAKTVALKNGIPLETVQLILVFPEKGHDWFADKKRGPYRIRY